jgi:spermidine synthase
VDTGCLTKFLPIPGAARAAPAGRLQLIAVLLLYSVTMFVGAMLLFVVQPMVGKMILPLLGGTPAVWSTCMVFFQAVLLGGYAYAHASAARLRVSRQMMLHLVLMTLPLAVLPLAVNSSLLHRGAANPVLDVLLLLSISVGLPFLVVSATAPLLQTWFTCSGHPAARDPYFLYAASNLGSMLALLGYPTLIEPRLHLRGESWMTQTRLWSVGYLALLALIGLCALYHWWRGAAAAPEETSTDALPEPPPVGLQYLRWIVLAFVPSSLMIGATTYITTDIAAVPLLWVMPLALYLLSFILAFGRWPARLQRLVVALTVPAVLVVMFLILSALKQRIWITVLWHFLLLFLVALACHGELALTRPSSRRLTRFYLLLSVGGVLGGLFNGLVAPALFHSLVEYPLVMVLACVLVGGPRPRRAWAPGAVALDVVLAVAVGAAALVLYSDLVTIKIDTGFFVRLMRVPSEVVAEWITPAELTVNKVLGYGVPLVALFFLRRRRLALALGLLAVLIVGDFVDARNENQILKARSFFGVLQVTRDHTLSGYTELRHGTTLHGRQSLDQKLRQEPLAYYHRGSPIALVMAELERRSTILNVAVIGLGTGTMAAFARPGDTITFYEIDPLVREVATNRFYFAYVPDAIARGARVQIEMGDARIRMEQVHRERPGERYDLIVVDAFSSDAIPVHLLTREAFRLYFDMLSIRGLLVLHLSNRYLSLEPVVANLAEDAHLEGRLLRHDLNPPGEGAASSTWAVLARTPAALGDLPKDPGWTAATLETSPRVGVWTDDFHNLLRIFDW